MSWSDNGEFVFTAHRLSQLKNAGVYDEDMRFVDWDDSFNHPISNGHDRTVGTCAFDLLRMLQHPKMVQRHKNHIWLYGPPGRGKTHLARWMAVYESVCADLNASFLSLPQTLQALKDRAGGSKVEVHLSPAFQAPILILDDIGMERTTFDVETVQRLIEHRRTKHLTIITSNHRPVKRYYASIWTEDKKEDIVYESYRYLLLHPERKQEQESARYFPLCHRLLDRLNPSIKSDSFLMAELCVQSENSHRE